MNLTSFKVVLAILLTSVISAFAAEKRSEKPKENKPAAIVKKPQKKHPRHQSVEVTGSYIKRDVQRNGFVADGPSPVYVLDNETIRNSGAADVRELLVRRGVNR